MGKAGMSDITDLGNTDLGDLSDIDAVYLERNQVVAGLAALELGYTVGVTLTAIDGWDPEWHGCVYLDLPTGQCSWHYHSSHADLFAFLPPYTGTSDRHDTAEKYRRLLALRDLKTGGTLGKTD
jgi:hypothetical protein